jgi:hypothetical protein
MPTAAAGLAAIKNVRSLPWARAFFLFDFDKFFPSLS